MDVGRIGRSRGQPAPGDRGPVRDPDSGSVRFAVEDFESVEIELDGTPLDAPQLAGPIDLPAGVHRVEFRGAGIGTHERSFEIEAGDRTVVMFEPIRLDPATAVYAIEVDPPEAELKVEGVGVEVFGRGEHRWIEISDPADRSPIAITISHDGYNVLDHELIPKPGDRRFLSFRLIPNPASGAVPF